MTIKSATKEYSVNIYNDFAPVESLAIDDKSFCVIDKRLYEIYKETVFSNIQNDKIYLLEATEENKVIDSALEICEKLTQISAKRNTRLISFGGGIIQDVTGFVANILYRGIKWTFFPTTLLAACDSCIGGKTSLNYKRFKNLLGTFYPPDEIHICTPFFYSLSERDFLSGLGEVVKFNIMQGETGIKNMENNIGLLLSREENALKAFTESSLVFKKRFIEEDEFDKGVRIQLNFAHTFGHAFETVSDYAIPHGTAVAMGTIVANKISVYRGWMQEEISKRIENVICQIVHIEKDPSYLNMEKILSAIHKDKKQIGNSLTAVLIRGDEMHLEIVHDVTEKEISDSIEYMFSII